MKKYRCRGFVAAASLDAFVKTFLASIVAYYVAAYVYPRVLEPLQYLLAVFVAGALIFRALEARYTRYSGGLEKLRRPGFIPYFIGYVLKKKVYMYEGVPVICELEVVETSSKHRGGRRDSKKRY